METTINTIKNTFNNLFDGLSTEHRQNNFYKEHGNFIDPVEVKINREQKLGFYVPFKEKLETILSLPETVVLDKETNKMFEKKNIY